MNEDLENARRLLRSAEEMYNNQRLSWEQKVTRVNLKITIAEVYVKINESESRNEQ